MVLYPLLCSGRSSYPNQIDKKEVMVVSDVYLNVLMIIIEEIKFQINSFTFLFLGKDVVIKRGGPIMTTSGQTNGIL